MSEPISEPITKSTKSLAEWQALLSGEAYAVLFEEATEPPGSSALNQEKGEGTFVCAACHLPLFQSASKYESGTGWPSFFAHVDGHIETKTDYKRILPRREYHCARCGGHQGHVFKDGPAPTGQRYCNTASRGGSSRQGLPNHHRGPDVSWRSRSADLAARLAAFP